MEEPFDLDFVKNAAISEDKVSEDSDKQNTLSIIENKEGKTKSTTPRFNFVNKLKYEPDMEISQFLTSVESFCQANSIHKEQHMINITISCLNQQSESGLACNILSDDDKRTWASFKAKIQSILGFSKEHYKAKFNSYKKIEQEKLGITLSNLVNCFKRGWGTGDRPLYSIESELILERFISSLPDGSLKTMLKAEKRLLTLENVLERANELESVFDTQQVNSVNQKSPISEIVQKLKEGHEELKSQFARMKNDEHQKKRASKRQVSLKTLGGLCSYYVLNNECPRQECRYRHTGPVSEEQQQLVKQLLKK